MLEPGLRQRVARSATAVMTAALLFAPSSSSAQARIIDSGDVDGRLQRLERLMSTSTLADLLARVDQLQREVRDLRGMIELQGHELAQLKQRQRDLYLDVDGRLKRMEPGGGASAAPADGATTTGGGAGAVGVPPASAITPPVAAAQTPEAATPAPPAEPVVDPLQEQSDYQAAFNLLKEARYDDAAKALSEFLKRYPDGGYADNAQYWLGESYYVTRKFPQSLAEFEKLVARYPSSQKYTHALLKVGYIHDELGNRADAIRVLDDLVRRFPSSAAAGLAKKRLERLR